MSDKLISATTTIDAPPEVVFAIVSNPHQHPRIDGSGSVQSLIEGPDHVTKGDTFGVSMKLFGMPYKITNKVVEYEPARLIAWRHFGGHRWRYELEPTGERHPRHRDLRLLALQQAVEHPHRGDRLPPAQPGRHRGHPGAAQGRGRGRCFTPPRLSLRSLGARLARLAP